MRRVRTGNDYRASLDDGRAVYVDGERLTNCATHAILGRAVDTVAAGYDHWYRSGPDAVNPLLGVTVTAADLQRLVPLFDEADALLNLTYQSIMCLLTAAGRVPIAGPAGYLDRINAHVLHLQRNDLRSALCITDAKGNRGLGPTEQHDPDLYTRVVERKRDGVVIRGAKLHITAGPLAHEFLVMPTKAMKANEADYAICCSVPVNAPGVKVIWRSPAPRGDARDHPFSSRGSLGEGFVVFDDVFVPHERVFLDGETQYAAVFAHSLGLWERLKALGHMADNADELAGLAQLIAEANGLERIAHIREKINDIVLYATMVRAGLEAAVSNARETPEGIAVPDELYTNAAKYFGAEQHAIMVRNLLDIAGGLVVTAPTNADADHPDLAGLVEKYLSTGPAVPGHYRLRLLHAIRDLTADTAGGHRAVIQLHAGGGLYAQRSVARRHYDMERAKRRVRAVIDLPELEQR